MTHGVFTRLAGASIIVAAAMAAAPAQAQPYPPQPYPYPSQGGVAGQIERGGRTAVDVVGAIANAVQGTRESFVVGACRARAAYYGNATIMEVYPKGKRDLKVNGVIDPASRYGGQYAGQYGGPGYGGQGYGYNRNYERLTFSCTVRPDGSIKKFKTKRFRG